jgi:tetraacyldisaccharide 4'-kinase
VSSSVRRLVEAAWRGERPVVDALLVLPEMAFRGASAVFHGAYDAGVRKQARAAVPVISVGNLTVGGSGKTPFTRWLVERLLERGHTPGILHGGYGSDEPALHRAWFPDLPVVAGKDRVRTAARAVAQGASVLVMDDGFQHRRLARQADLVLVAAEDWPAPRRRLPRGPWREGVTALRRATAVVVTRRVTRADQAAAVAVDIETRTGRPVAQVALRADRWLDRAGRETLPPPAGAVAVAAIAKPAHFFANAEAAGARLSRRLSFGDHHVYDSAELAQIREAAAGTGVVTTAKDAVKLDGLGDTPVWILEQRLHVEAGLAMLLHTLAGVAP